MALQLSISFQIGRIEFLVAYDIYFALEGAEAPEPLMTHIVAPDGDDNRFLKPLHTRSPSYTDLLWSTR